MIIDQTGNRHIIELDVDETINLIARLSAAIIHTRKYPGGSLFSEHALLVTDERNYPSAIAFHVQGK